MIYNITHNMFYGSVLRYGGRASWFLTGLMTFLIVLGELAERTSSARDASFNPGILLIAPTISLAIISIVMMLLSSRLDLPFAAGTSLRTAARLVGFLLLLKFVVFTSLFVPQLLRVPTLIRCCETAKKKVIAVVVLTLVGLASWGLLYFSMS